MSVEQPSSTNKCNNMVIQSIITGLVGCMLEAKDIRDDGNKVSNIERDIEKR